MVVVKGNSDLPHLIAALHPSSRFARGLDGGQK
jgi:hypothetical protein